MNDVVDVLIAVRPVHWYVYFDGTEYFYYITNAAASSSYICEGVHTIRFEAVDNWSLKDSKLITKCLSLTLPALLAMFITNPPVRVDLESFLTSKNNNTVTVISVINKLIDSGFL